MRFGVFSIACVLAAPLSLAAQQEAKSKSDVLRLELIESVLKDLENEKAKEPPSLQRTQQLAAVVEQLTRAQTGPSDRNGQGWFTYVLANTSKTSVSLARKLVEQEEQDRAEDAKKMLLQCEETGKAAAAKLNEIQTGPELDPVIDSLSSAIEKLGQSENSRQSPIHRDLMYLLDFVRRWQNFLVARDAGQSQEADDHLRALISFERRPRFLDNAEFSKKVEITLQALGKIPPEAIKEKIFQLANRSLAATTPEEIDALFKETAALAAARMNQDGLRRELGELRDFLKELQDGIIALSKNDEQALKSTTGMLMANAPRYTETLSVPRSKILLRVDDFKKAFAKKNPLAAPKTGLPSPDAVLAKMVDLNSIEPHLAELQEAYTGLENPPQHWQMVPSALKTLVSRVAELQQGNGQQRAVFENPLNPAISQLSELQRQYDLLCLNVSFAAETGLVPVPTESPEDYARRIIPVLVEKQEWELLRTLSTACQSVKVSSSVFSINDGTALDAWIFGMKQENDAKDIRAATLAYQYVLTSSSLLIPAKIVGGRLENLRKNHPTEYQSGVDSAISFSRGETKARPGARDKQLSWTIPNRKPVAP